ncbi:MAG TPA: ROK family protein [Verrucomicrobiae bacterium]|nr:ROK family protein [Verrucomicrobiae bacterium]
MKTAIGIDIGGTKISMVLGTPSGKILVHRRIPTRTGAETKACIAELKAAIREILHTAKAKKYKVLGIGIGAPGAVDSRTGIVPRSPHLKGWKGLPLARLLEKEFSLPVLMANDANAAAVAEKIFGQAKGCQHFIYMTVSTGIGGGIYTFGKLLEGANYVAGEIGHMIIVPDGNLCSCGNEGCLEAYSSGTAIARHAESQVRKGKRTILAARMDKQGFLTGRDVGEAATKRDSVAVKSFEKAGYYLGIGIANLLNIINPEKVILGGGVWASAPRRFEQIMMQSCRHHAWPEAVKKVKIVRSKLKGSVGDLGALALVFERLK